MSAVNWSLYARRYDRMAESNPAYQELLAYCVSTARGWPLRRGDVIADFGGGTGNFSIALALVLPEVEVLHVDFEPQMLAIAGRKATQARAANWRIVHLDLDEERAWPLPKLAAAVTVHCLYSTKQPRQVILRLCSQLAEGGGLFACDLGRVMNVADWARYLIGCSFRARGLVETLKLLALFGIVRRQNRLAGAAQRDRTYWTHDLAEFRACFEAEGITVREASNQWYRGYDDLVVGHKPAASRCPPSPPRC